MRGHHVSLHTDDPVNWVDRWTVYRCLMAEVPGEDHLYVLYDRQWWEFAADLVSEVDAYLRYTPTAAVRRFPGHGRRAGSGLQRARRTEP